jgi:hypothetical protein
MKPELHRYKKQAMILKEKYGVIFFIYRYRNPKQKILSGIKEYMKKIICYN